MVNRSRTARRGMQPALALRPWLAPSISAPACREGRPPAARLTCARQLTRGRPRRGGAHVALRPEGDQRPAPRSVSNCRHGVPAPPSPLMMAAPRSRAAWLRFRAPPVDRQHPAGLDTARRRPARPGSPPHRSADRPPSRHRPARIPRIVAACAPVVRSARLRPVRSALSRMSAAHRRSVRCDLALNPAPAAHVAASPARWQPLKLPGSRLRRPVRDPRHPHPGPPLSSRRGQGPARTHMPPRAAWKFPERKSERGAGAPCKPR